MSHFLCVPSSLSVQSQLGNDGGRRTHEETVMSEASVASTIDRWLDRLRGGDARARDMLLQHAVGRFHSMARRMLRAFPGVRRWEDTGDVAQNASVRLWTALASVVPESSREFFRFASVEIRRELIDLARHYYGPQGHGARHESGATGTDSGGSDRVQDASNDTYEPTALATWSEFHAEVARLPDEEREVVDLLWYQGLTQGEAARLLAVSVPTVKRRWLSVRLRLRAVLGAIDNEDT